MTTRPAASTTARARAARRRQIADLDDPPIANADVGPNPRPAGAVHNIAAEDEQVERRSGLDVGHSARPGRSPVAAPSTTTQRPLTMTRLMPAGRAIGSSTSVARLAIVAGSKRKRSAA